MDNRKISKINKDNVNEFAPKLMGRVGRSWIDTMHPNDTKGLCYIMSLKPNMETRRPHTQFPSSLLRKPLALQLYIELGGPFKDFLLSCRHFHFRTLSTETQSNSIRILFERGANPPDFDDPTLFVPPWVKKVYQEVERRRENCRAACIILCAMRQWPKQRCVFLNRSQRDVLGIVIQNVWQKRTSEEWEI
jgi:hypothetical protein